MRDQESEKTLEARLREEVKKAGGIALKFTSQYHRGIPDRIVLMPGGRIYFVEMKSTGRSATRLQKAAIRHLQEMGFNVRIIDTSEKLAQFITEIRTQA